jgi:hypothetical protein
MKSYPSKRKDKAILPMYVKGLYNGKYTLRQASESTGYTREHLCVLKKQYSLLGDSLFEHRNRGRVPKNKTNPKLAQRIALLYSAHYSDVNFSYFCRCLEEFEDIKISLATLRKIMKDYGLVSPEAHRIKKKKPVHRPRLRRECEGDLLQVDGTPYAWFYRFGDNKRYCLTGGIDDATGKITGLYLTEFECLYGYLEVLRQTCRTYGVPREIYSDRAAIFCYTPKGPNLAQWEKLEVMHEKRTQWQRICEELHINQILAWSPEAKGRVERMWRTIQGQLPVWLYKNGIQTVEDANREIHRYIESFNKAYAVAPADDDNFYIDAPSDLDDILCAQISRKTDRAGVFSFHSYKFELLTEFASYRTFTLCISERGIFGRLSDGLYVPVRCLDEPLSGLGETMPIVVQNIIYRYLFAFAKEISA